MSETKEMIVRSYSRLINSNFQYTFKILRRIIIIIISLINLSHCTKKSDSFENIKIGYFPACINTLLFIAEERKYFFKEGLYVSLIPYPTGKEALEALFKENLDMAIVGDMGIVTASLMRQDFKILATIGTSLNDFKIITRINKFRNPSDLKGKRIATVQGTQMNFFSELFLAKNGISGNDIQLVFKSAADLPKALATGEVDAISTREPVISQTKQLMGEKNYQVWEYPGLFRATSNLVVTDEFIKNKSSIINNILRALVLSENYMFNHGKQAIKITADKIHIDKAELEKIWPHHLFQVTLDQSLILTLEHEARWTTKTKLSRETEIPNFLDLVYPEGLNSVNPNAVSIIR